MKIDMRDVYITKCIWTIIGYQQLYRLYSMRLLKTKEREKWNRVYHLTIRYVRDIIKWNITFLSSFSHSSLSTTRVIRWTSLCWISAESLPKLPRFLWNMYFNFCPMRVKMDLCKTRTRMMRYDIISKDNLANIKR